MKKALERQHPPIECLWIILDPAVIGLQLYDQGDPPIDGGASDALRELADGLTAPPPHAAVERL